MGLIRTTKCRGCGAQIAFIKTVKGKSMPVNPDAIYFVRGSEFNAVTLDGEVFRGRTPGPGEAAMIGYISHWATCPEANGFRKKQKSERRGAGEGH